MKPFPLAPAAWRRVLYVVAGLGLVAALFGAIVGWLVISEAEATLRDSLRLTGNTLEALDASSGVARDSVDAVAAGLSTLSEATSAVNTSFEQGEQLMVNLADLVEDEIGGSIRSVDEALPGIIRVADTIDTTLSALSLLPFGPDYSPDESFADALRRLSTTLDGVPERLEEQAALILLTSQSLGDTGERIGDLADRVAELDTALRETGNLLDTYDQTITEGAEVVRRATDDLGRTLTTGRIAILLISLAFAALQVIPLQLAATTGTVAGSRENGTPTTE